MATGWLGWSPDVAMNTPMPQIMLALEGKMEFVHKSNPFGASPTKKAKQKKSNIDAQRTAFSFMKAEARQSHEAKKCQIQQSAY